MPWIIDSVERVIRSNTTELSGIFGFDKSGTVYSRSEAMMSGNGLIGLPLNAMKQAMHGAEAARMLLPPYDTLVSSPAKAVAAVYRFADMAVFMHDTVSA